MFDQHCRFVTLLGLLLLATSGCKSGVGGREDYSMNGSPLAGSRMQHSLDPMSTNAFEQARELERNGQTTAALQRYVQMADANPNQPAVWQRMAVAYDKVGQRQSATSCYERAIELDPLNADLWCDCGYGQFLAADFESAERSFRRALDINPSLERAHNNLGLAMAKLGDTSGAVEHFKMAGCDVHQAAENLKLARGAPIMAQSDPLPVVMPAPNRLPAPMPLAERPSISSQLAAELSAIATQHASELSTMVAQPAAELPVAMQPLESPAIVQSPAQLPAWMPSAELPPITSQSAAELPPMSTQLAAELSTMVAQPAAELPVAMLPLESPMVMQTISEPGASAEAVSRLNYYATDPSLAKSVIQSPIATSPTISDAVANAPPKAFSSSIQQPFLPSQEDSSGGVYNLISDFEEDTTVGGQPPAKAKSEVVRRIGDED